MAALLHCGFCCPFLQMSALEPVHFSSAYWLVNIQVISLFTFSKSLGVQVWLGFCNILRISLILKVYQLSLNMRYYALELTAVYSSRYCEACYIFHSPSLQFHGLLYPTKISGPWPLVSLVYSLLNCPTWLVSQMAWHSNGTVPKWWHCPKERGDR